VIEGKTGHVVDGRDVDAVADRLIGLLSDDERRRAMGAAGREWVTREWQWSKLGARLQGLLQPT
jgi:phosphatidylinositol alpha-1,6-mannosyltransferase